MRIIKIAELLLFLLFATRGMSYAQQTESLFDVLVSTGYLTVTGTSTIQGNGFSVGGSSFVVNGGAVGIGTQSPGTPLDVVGAINGTSSVTASAFFGDGSNLTGINGLLTGGVNTIYPKWTGANTLGNSFASEVSSGVTISTNVSINGSLSLIGSANSWKSWTPTLIGWSAAPTCTYFYNKIGRMVTMQIDCTSWGTSNSIYVSFSLPFANIVRGGTCGISWSYDNGTFLTTPGRMYVASSKVAFTKNVGDLSNDQWTASGNKMVGGVCIYESTN